MLDPSEAEHVQSEAIFFGGTALSRTFLPNGRLSEDLDLYTGDRKGLVQELDGLPELIEQEFPRAAWDQLPLQAVDEHR